MKNYISIIDSIIVKVMRFVKGTNKCPCFISNRSRKIYGRRDNLKRYWFAKYKNLIV